MEYLFKHQEGDDDVEGEEDQDESSDDENILTKGGKSDLTKRIKKKDIKKLKKNVKLNIDFEEDEEELNPVLELKEKN